MFHKSLMTLLFLAAFGFSSGAWADCVYQGKSYPTGTKLGGLTCQADGSWR